MIIGKNEQADIILVSLGLKPAAILYNLDKVLIIAPDNKTHEQVEEAVFQKDTYKTGILMGYPETAVKAFVEKKYIRNVEGEEKLSDEILNDPEHKFLNFRLSRDNWQEEFKTVKEWARVIKENAPELYEEILAENVYWGLKK